MGIQANNQFALGLKTAALKLIRSSTRKAALGDKKAKAWLHEKSHRPCGFMWCVCIATSGVNPSASFFY